MEEASWRSMFDIRSAELVVDDPAHGRGERLIDLP
jgi:hypothetical protein